MTIVAARRFHLALLSDAKLRGDIAEAKSPDQRQTLLESRSGSFSMEEFEEAHLGLLTECQHAEQAEDLKYARLFGSSCVAREGHGPWRPAWVRPSRGKGLDPFTVSSGRSERL